MEEFLPRGAWFKKGGAGAAYFSRVEHKNFLGGEDKKAAESTEGSRGPRLTWKFVKTGRSLCIQYMKIYFADGARHVRKDRNAVEVRCIVNPPKRHPHTRRGMNIRQIGCAAIRL